ncbi:hypothetical protein D3C81_876820 [compost metagenome]
MQGGQLDRDRRPRPRTDLGRLPHRLDRPPVVGAVFLGVGGGQRRLAEHVEGIGIAPLTVGTAIAQRLVDAAAEDELVAHQLHRLVHRRADHRLAGALQQVADDAGRLTVANGRIDQPAGQHQAPGGEVDQHVVAVAQVLLPLRGAQAVADQRVGGGGVRHAQQGLGQAHQHQAFAGVQAVLAQQGIEGVGGIVAAAHPLD